jgi:predicted ATPase/DNA-binding winged helix-turn-helix (wHTH) protein
MSESARCNGVDERSNSSAERIYLFGPFRLVPAQQLLLKGEKNIRIGSRAFAILTALVERAGDLVTKHELMEIAWPRTVVENSNLKVTVASLRRVLGESAPGDRYLTNEPGRGYRFIAPVLCADASGAAARVQGSQTCNLPYPSTRMIGRDETVLSLAKTLSERRVLSIVGPGGIGKTVVALAVADILRDQFEDGAHFVDLASLSDARLVPMALAKTLGVTIHSESAFSAVVMALRKRRLLLVFDSCEHVLATTAELIDTIIGTAPGVLALATTREPLRIRGETIHRLAPLATPITAGLTVSSARRFSAVELFVERASAAMESFRLSDDDAPVVADMCQKLEGIPLAIELAAPRVDTFTLRELSALLDDPVLLLNLSQNSACIRHRSLAAALEWSYALLTENERTVLRRLSVFARAFTLASAQGVAGEDCDVVAAVDGLVAKSLVSADVAGISVQYRLRDVTRRYAAQKLLESGEHDNIRSRHADCLLSPLLTGNKKELQ